MTFIFKVRHRRIHLSLERWKRIRGEHPDIAEPEQVAQVLTQPDKITASDRDEKVCWYYRYNKARRRYLKVAVKYLNGHGYVITAHFTSNIE